ncbi:MAG TPA: PAS domain S-box protein [Actinomycetota bacterium]|nr:PAS domain S-box protein [Actinomycetota bacterium]
MSTIAAEAVESIDTQEHGSGAVDRLFRLAPDLLMAIGFDGSIQAINPAGLALLGYALADLRGIDMIELVHPDDLAGVRAALDRALATGKGSTGVHCRMRRGDGSFLPLSISGTVDREAGCYYFVARDVSLLRQAESELRASNEHWRAIFDASPLGIALVGPDLRVTGANPALCRLVDMETYELSQHTILELTPPDESAESLEQFALLANGQLPSIVVKKSVRRRDGSLIPTRITCAVLRDGTGALTELVAFVEDITEEVEAGRQLAENAAQLRVSQALVSEAQVLAGLGAFSLDLLTGSTTWSDELYRINGLEPGSFTPTYEGFLSMVHPDDRAALTAAMEEALHGSGGFDLELRVVRDGKIMWQSVKAQVELGEDGSPLRLHGAVQDVTDRHQAREAERQLAAIVASSSAAILGLTPDGTITSWNRGAERLYGHPASAVIGHSISMILPDSISLASTMFPSVAAGRAVVDLEGAGKRSDGSVFPISVSASPLLDADGRVERLAVVIQDISERKRAQEQLQAAYREATKATTTLSQQASEMAQVNELAELLQSCVNLEEAHELIGIAGRRLFPGFSGAVFVLPPSRDELVAEAGWGNAAHDPPFSPQECWALRRGQAYRRVPGREQLSCRHVPGAGRRGYLCVPLLGQGEALGVLHLRAAKQPVDEAEPDFDQVARLAATVGEHLSLALANFALRDTLRSQSIRDPLTGLYNRRYMEESMERELNRAARGGTPVGVIQVDLDHFKSFNDSFGHAAGDAVLRAFGACAKGLVRAEDIACRYGGEEFTLIIPGADRAATASRAEALRAAVEGLVAESRGQSLGGITLSAGVAAFPVDAGTLDDLLHVADAALYRAKEAGRNRVMCAGDPDPEPARRGTASYGG